MSPGSSPIFLALSSYDKAAVVEVIKNNPVWRTVNQLGDAFIELANAKPYITDKIAEVIAGLESDPDIPLIKTTDFHEQPVQILFKQILREVIFDLIKRVFANDIPSIDPTNPFLVSALISGACIRTGLCNSSTQSGMITSGLRFEGTRWWEIFSGQKAQVWAIHASLHLLAGGTRIYHEEQIGYRQGEVLPALKAIAEQNVVTNLRGKDTGVFAFSFSCPLFSSTEPRLKIAIAEAEAGFPSNIPFVDIWKILFP
ncbi:hypothetical protein M413DRAFT_30454 [Hebeloma cylindrosporum]|uniref:Uncharacterized protein n=1 Tax=Hebeloma cylindrosporum TaxID=76867 RepID=A0A0C2XJW0_HEBCY|nr:hypothetical protein M413DRAFT_30454 [Hebeloma cylindrosporum h7]